MIKLWSKTSLLILLYQYKLEDIYKLDKCGLFCQYVPSNTFHLKSEMFSGGKHSEIIITGVAAANVVGDKLPIIGKS